jgi:hypothetical protein
LDKEEQKEAPRPSTSAAAASEFYAPTKGPQIFIETKDDASVSSHLSDPDEDADDPLTLGNGQSPPDALDESHSDIGFDRDAPWMARFAPGNASSIEEEEEDEPKSKFAASIIGPATEPTTPPRSSGSVSGGDKAAETDPKPAALKDPPLSEPEVSSVESNQSFPRNESPPSVVVTAEALNGTANDDGGTSSEVSSTPKSLGSKTSTRSDVSVKLIGENSIADPNASDAEAVLPEFPLDQDGGEDPRRIDTPDSSVLVDQHSDIESQ